MGLRETGDLLGVYRAALLMMHGVVVVVVLVVAVGFLCSTFGSIGGDVSCINIHSSGLYSV